MFQISEQTKADAIEEMRKVLGDGPTDSQLEDAFEAAVAIVKKQFGF